MSFQQTRVMGIVNVTPDSFSDGGQFYRPEEAVRRARNLLAEGADFIDLGGESTRPGAEALGWEAEWHRVEPVLRALADVPSAMKSVDTYHPETAERALAMGVGLLNCVREREAAEIVRVASASGREDVEVVLPAQALGTSVNEAALRASNLRFYLDPLVGFGTTRQEDIQRLRSVETLVQRGRVLVGASRKRIVQFLTGERQVGKLLGGSVGVAVWCALKGAAVVRVHDVRETVQALRVVASLAGEIKEEFHGRVA